MSAVKKKEKMSTKKSAYAKLLFAIGFPEGLTISACLAAQKARLGGWWWLGVVLTFLFTIALLVGEILLFLHIVNFKVPEDTYKF